MASEQQLRDVRMACLFGDEFRQTENITASKGNATLLDILRPGLEAQRAQVIANLNEHGGSQQPSLPKNLQCREEVPSDCSIDDMVSISSIYDFIDKEYDCIQQYSGASTCTESTKDIFRDRSSSGTRSAYTDTYSSTSYAGTGSLFSGSADSAIGMDKSNGTTKKREKVPECRSDMMIWKDLDIGEAMGVVYMPNGNVAVSDFETHDIVIYNDLGIRVSSSQEGGLKLTCPRGLAYHPQESGLLVAEWTKGRLLMLSSDARKKLRRINVSMRPFAVGVLSNGDLVVVGMFKLHGTWSGGAAIIDLKGKEKKRWRGGLDKPWHVVVGPRDLIYVSDFRSHCILVFTSEGRKVRCIKGGPSDDLSFPKGLCLLNDLILVCHDVTSVSGGKNSRLTAWTRHGRYVGIVLNWPAQGGCRLRGIAVQDDILVAVGNYKIMTYKLTFRDVIRRSLPSQQNSRTEVDAIYDNSEYVYKNPQHQQFMQNKIALLNHHNQQNINASKVQRVIPFVRSPCDTISENDDNLKDLQMWPLEKLPPSEPGDLRGPLFPDTPQPYAPPMNMKQMQDNPNVIYQRGIKYFRGYTSGRKTTYNPIYSPADTQHTINPTPELSDDQEDQSAYIDFDANTPDVRKSYMCFSQGSFYSSQPNLNSPDPWVYQSQSSVATRSEPYSPCYYDMKPCSPNYIDLHYIRHTTLPRSPFDVSESELHLQNVKSHKSFDGSLPCQTSPMPVQPAYLKRHLLSPSAHILPPTVEVEDQHPIDIITKLYDDILKLDDEDKADGDERSNESNDEEAIENSQINDNMQQDNVNKNQYSDVVTLDQEMKIEEKLINQVANEHYKDIDAVQIGGGSPCDTMAIDLTAIPTKPYIPEPPPLIGKVLHPSQRKKQVNQACSNASNCSENEKGQGIPKPTPPPVAKKPQVDKARLHLRHSFSISPEERVQNISQETLAPKSQDSDMRGKSTNEINHEKEKMLHQGTATSCSNSDNMMNFEVSTLPIHQPNCKIEHRGHSSPAMTYENGSKKTEKINQQNPKEGKLSKDESDNLETTRRLLSYTPSSPAQALAKILKASVAKPAWEIDTTDDERVNSVLGSIFDLSEEEVDVDDDKPSGIDAHGSDDRVDKSAIQAELANATKSQAYAHHCIGINSSTVDRDQKNETDESKIVNQEAEKLIISSEPDNCNVESKLPDIIFEQEKESYIGDESLQTQMEKEIDRKLISPSNTIQRGKPNTYNGKPVVHRTRTVSPQRVDSFEATTFPQNLDQKLAASIEHLIASSPDFPPPPSPASLEQLPDELRRCVMSPLMTNVMASLKSSKTTTPINPEIGISKKVTEELRNMASPAPYLPPPPPITQEERFLPTPDLPPPPMPLAAEIFAAKAHTTSDGINNYSQVTTRYLDQGIPITRVANKPLKGVVPFSAAMQKPPKCKTLKTIQPSTKHKHFAALHNIIRKAFHHKNSSNGKIKDAKGCMMLSRDETLDNSHDTSTLRSNFRHSFCNSQIKNQAENQIDPKNSTDIHDDIKAEEMDQKENGSQKKRTFQRRNTICGVSVLKASQTNTLAAKTTGGTDPHSEV